MRGNYPSAPVAGGEKKRKMVRMMTDAKKREMIIVSSVRHVISFKKFFGIILRKVKKVKEMP